jgi:hypothetical protein
VDRFVHEAPDGDGGLMRGRHPTDRTASRARPGKASFTVGPRTARPNAA